MSSAELLLKSRRRSCGHMDADQDQEVVLKQACMIESHGSPDLHEMASDSISWGLVGPAWFLQSCTFPRRSCVPKTWKLQLELRKEAQ